MTDTLKTLIADCQGAIDLATGKKDLDAIRKAAEKATADPGFVAEHFGPDAESGMHTIYRDPDQDFMILAHIREEAFKSPPHDHGASWAVYCQVAEHVDMEEFRRKDDGSEGDKADLELKRSYRLNPGEAGFFDSFEIHSINVPGGARFLRITGTDLSKLATSRFDMRSGTVSVNAPN